MVPYMNKEQKPKRKPNEQLDVVKVMEDFQKTEESSSHRNGTFKIDKPFEEALETILKSRPNSNRAWKEDKNGK